MSVDTIDPTERETLVAAYLAEERKAAEADLCWVMSTIEGRRFVDMLRRDTGLKAASYQSDPYDTAFNEGRRSVGIELEARLMAPGVSHLLDLMEKEHRDRIRARNDFIAGSRQ